MGKGRDRLAVVTFNHVPEVNHTFKYERLGAMAMENRRLYCERKGYSFISEVPPAEGRPACWAKIPALLGALQSHRWALWADSDALLFDADGDLERFCDPDHDLVVQSHEEFYQLIGMPLERGLDAMPLNSGVFLIQASAWSLAFLEAVYAQSQYVTHGEVWDGIGEQEAMIHLLRRHPEDRRRIKYVEGLQNHPRLYRRGDAFVHFYGNHAPHRIGADDCEEVLARWETANRTLSPFPPDRARFHWCCIQNKQPGGPKVRGDLGHYLYTEADLLPAA